MSIEQGSQKIGPFPYFLAGLGAISATAISFYTMFLHLKNYRRPELQRLTIRILWMVPIYAIASFVSLSSKSASDYIDTIRDIYEAFVIYSFFLLCISYLGGERSLLAMLEERMRTHHLWPFNLFFSPMDMSDPDTFLFVRRGVLQFVVLKPILSIVTMMLKLSGHYHEGYIGWGSAYMWLSLLYNLSVCWSLYCLVLFYVQCSRDLRPYRPIPKFVCVKSIVFLTFYQSLGVAFLVWVGMIREKGDYSTSILAMALGDFLICIEMPFLAMLHWYAFPWTDYDDQRLSSRVKFPHAVRDALGIKDIIQDTYHTFKGTTFREARRAQRLLRQGELDFSVDDERERRWLARKRRDGYGTLPTDDDGFWNDQDCDEDDALDDTASLEFPSPDQDPELEAQYESSRQLAFGDYNYPVLHEDERFRNPPRIQEQIDRHVRAYLSRESLRDSRGGIREGSAHAEENSASVYSVQGDEDLEEGLPDEQLFLDEEGEAVPLARSPSSTTSRGQIS